MMFCKFNTETHGKWVLAGEHAVIKGGPALAFPIKQKKLELDYTPLSSGLKINYANDPTEVMQKSFLKLLKQICIQLNLSFESLSGHFHLKSEIPIGFGMGASAALCVAITKWCIAQQLLDSEQLYPFAKSLENLFHGQSSGLDIAAVISDQPIYFQQGKFKPIQLNWKPKWFLSSCKQISQTSKCVQQTNSLWEHDINKATIINQRMIDATNNAKEALEQNTHDSITKLKHAINSACSCFKSWNLINSQLEAHIQSLQNKGAIAVKPTGSGCGGFVISLWEDIPSLPNIELISI